MTNHIEDGRLWLSNNGVDYLKVYCQNIFWTLVFMPEIEHYEGGVNIGFDLGKKFVIIKATGVWLDTNTKYENFVSYITAWQQANTLQVEVSRNTSNDKVKLDGSYTAFPVLITKGLNEMEKMAGDQQKYMISNLTIEQNGSAS